MTSPFTQALEQLEPVAQLFKDGSADPVAFSIAVSLKRIADSADTLVLLAELARLPKPSNPGDQS